MDLTADITADTTADTADTVNTSETVLAGAAEITAPAPLYTFAEEFKNHPSIEKFKGDPDKLAKSYLNLEKLIGSEKIAVPKNAEDLSAWEKFDNAFGVPLNAADYDFKDTAEKYKLTDEHLMGFKDLMKKHHISNAAASEILSEYVSSIEELKRDEFRREEAEKKETELMLRKEWGRAYEAKLEGAKAFLNEVTGRDETAINHILSKVGNDLTFIKLFADFAEMTSEGSLGGINGKSTRFVKTPDEARAELNSILNDKNDIYHREGAGHKERVAYVDGLLKQIYGLS